MILISHEIKCSPIHGIGLFTKQNVKMGELIARASPQLDVDVSALIFDSLDSKEQAEILYWGFYDPLRDTYHVAFDKIKFLNHSQNGNVTENMKTYDIFAVRDIKSGEELTQNYLEFEGAEDLLSRGIVESDDC